MFIKDANMLENLKLLIWSIFYQYNTITENGQLEKFVLNPQRIFHKKLSKIDL